MRKRKRMYLRDLKTVNPNKLIKFNIVRNESEDIYYLFFITEINASVALESVTGFSNMTGTKVASYSIPVQSSYRINNPKSVTEVRSNGIGYSFYDCITSDDLLFTSNAIYKRIIKKNSSYFDNESKKHAEMSYFIVCGAMNFVKCKIIEGNFIPISTPKRCFVKSDLYSDLLYKNKFFKEYMDVLETKESININNNYSGKIIMVNKDSIIFYDNIVVSSLNNRYKANDQSGYIVDRWRSGSSLLRHISEQEFKKTLKTMSIINKSMNLKSKKNYNPTAINTKDFNTSVDNYNYTSDVLLSSCFMLSNFTFNEKSKPDVV